MASGISSSAIPLPHRHPRRSAQEHLDALGFISLSANKLWCRRHGLSLSLEKSASERRGEVELARVQTSPKGREGHDPRRAETIRRIAAGACDGRWLPETERRVESNYRVALRESARIMALWRRREGLGYQQE